MPRARSSPVVSGSQASCGGVDCPTSKVSSTWSPQSCECTAVSSNLRGKRAGGHVKLASERRRRGTQTRTRTHRASAVRQRHAAEALLQPHAVRGLQLVELHRGGQASGRVPNTQSAKRSTPCQRLARASCRAAARGARAARPGSASRPGPSPARSAASAYHGTAQPSTGATEQAKPLVSAVHTCLTQHAAPHLGLYRDRRSVGDDVHRRSAARALQSPGLCA